MMRLTGRDLAKVLENITAPSEAHHAYVQARSLFNWLVKRRLIEYSLLAGMEAPQRSFAREHVLDESEIAQLLTLSRRWAIVRITLLLLATGQRLGQIANLRREFVDEKAGVIRVVFA